MTKIEGQALKVSRAWRRYTEIDRWLAKVPPSLLKNANRMLVKYGPARAAYKKELEILAKMVL